MPGTSFSGRSVLLFVFSDHAALRTACAATDRAAAPLSAGLRIAISLAASSCVLIGASAATTAAVAKVA